MTDARDTDPILGPLKPMRDLYAELGRAIANHILALGIEPAWAATELDAAIKRDQRAEFRAKSHRKLAAK